MADEAPAEPGAPPSFSTGFWKEFSLRHSRPAVYIAVLAAYALFILVLFATASSRDDHAWGNWLALGVLSAAVNVAAAVHAARRAPGPKGRAAVRRLLGDAKPTGRERVLSSWYRAEVLRSTAAPAVALAFLAPLYLAPGLAGIAVDPAQLAVGALLWLETAASAAVAVAAGAWAAQRRAPRRPGPMSMATAALAMAARSPLTLIAGGVLATAYWGYSDKSLPGICLAGAFLLADLLACFYAWHLLVEGGTARLSEALILAESEPELKDLAREDPESLGLDVSFWALFRWKLFRDPLFRAERRGFWTWRRLIILWVGFAAAQAAILLLSAGIWRLPLIDGPGMVVGALVQIVIQNMPFLVVATLVAATLATDRQSGALESMIITPVAPLRLAASRLAGKCCHPILAMAGLAVLVHFLWPWMVTGSFARAVDAPWGRHVYSIAVAWLHYSLFILAYGAVGLYFAARWRSLAAALPATYGFLIAFGLAVIALLVGLGVLLRSRDGSEGSMVNVLLTGLFLLAHGVLLRIFLMAAARELAVRRNE